MFQGYLSELNIWDRELSMAEIKKIKSCEIFIKGNVVQWDREKLKIVGQNPYIGIEKDEGKYVQDVLLAATAF